MLRPSRLLRYLRANRSSACLKINLSDPRVIEICGLAGIPSVWLCNEHVGNDWLNLENQIRAARLNDVDTIVRVSRGSYSDYIKPFELGATGIMVPHVTTVEEARQIVEWTRFHPLGKRAIDGGNVDGGFCTVPLPDYIAHSNAEHLVILQIESPEGLQNVEAIASVPGFDVLLFGAGDFCHRIGKPGCFDLPEVTAARRRIGAAARTHGKFAMSAGLPEPRAKMEAEGYRLFGIGSDVVAIGEYAKERLRAFINAPNNSEINHRATPVRLTT